MNLIQTWLLITVMALLANGAVNAKVASGGINLSNEVHQGLNDSKSLNALGISDVSTIYALSSSIVPNAGENSRRAYLNEKFGRSGDLNTDINTRGIELKSIRAQERAYRLSNKSDQELVLGRLDDTAAGAQIGMRRLNDPDWDIDVNEAWVQGGIDAKKPFYLGSDPFNEKNLISNNPQHPRTVFSQELDQLKSSGYKFDGDYLVPQEK